MAPELQRAPAIKLASLRLALTREHSRMLSRRLGLVGVFGLTLLAACERSVVAPPNSNGAPRALGDTARVGPSFSYAALASGLLITPIGLDFGDIQVGTTATSQTVTITNIAGTPVTMSGVGGAPPSGFFGASQGCQGLTLAPDASCTMTFDFSPQAAGFQTDASIGTWNGQAFNIQLRGTGVAPKLQAVQTGLDFGYVQVGASAPQQFVTFKNVGVAPIVMSGSGGAPLHAEFGGAQSCQGLTLAVGATCTMQFGFTPTTPGELFDDSKITWSGQPFDIKLHGIGVLPNLQLSPSALDFGEVRVGTTAPQQLVKITNRGTAPVTMSGSGGAPLHVEFGASQSCQGLTLAVGASCTMQFDFTPSAPGDLTDASNITWNGTPFSIALHGIGLSATATPSVPLRLTPTGLDFGQVTVGGSAPQQLVTITNVSSANVTMSGSGGAPLHAEFGGSQSCQGLVLAPGASCTMQFGFTPTTPGALSDDSKITWNGQPFDIKLHGVGAAPMLRASPSSLDFGDVQTGSTSAQQIVSITNQSPITITMSGAGGAPLHPEFGASQSCQGLAIAPGASCTMQFSFNPTAAGNLNDDSKITWNGQPFDIALHGNGVAPKLLLTPFALDFGLVPLGASGPQQFVHITNIGLDVLKMSGAGGAPLHPEFGGAQSCQGLTLARGQSCTMQFGFTPTAAGLLTDASQITWNGQPFNIALQGTGFSGIADVDMDLSPGAISLTGTPTTSAVLLSSATFDATTVTLANVRMQVNGITDVAPVSRGGVVVSSVRDWNGDGRPDRIFSFQTSALAAAGLAPGAGSNALILRDNLSASKWRARDAAPPTFVP